MSAVRLHPKRSAYPKVSAQKSCSHAELESHKGNKGYINLPRNMRGSRKTWESRT